MLNWKGGDLPTIGYHGYRGEWRARASRIVGGEYTIKKSGGDRDYLAGHFHEIDYAVTYREAGVTNGNLRHLYDYDLGKGRSKRHVARTLDRAMAIAQADHDYRCRIRQETMAFYANTE
jgi:hypothetical protein